MCLRPAFICRILFLRAISDKRQKTATTSRSNEDGTLSEVKITLELKNHSKKLIKEVMVTDLVPSIANIDRGLGTGNA